MAGGVGVESSAGGRGGGGGGGGGGRRGGGFQQVSSAVALGSYSRVSCACRSGLVLIIQIGPWEQKVSGWGVR